MAVTIKLKPRATREKPASKDETSGVFHAHRIGSNKSTSDGLRYDKEFKGRKLSQYWRCSESKNSTRNSPLLGVRFRIASRTLGHIKTDKSTASKRIQQQSGDNTASSQALKPHGITPRRCIFAFVFTLVV